MNRVVTIWKKELRDNIRDKRTLLSTIILPMLLMPAIIVGMGKFAQYQMEKAEDVTVTIGVQNAGAARSFVDVLEKTERVSVVEFTGDPQTAVRDQEADVAIVFSDGFQSQVEARAQIQLEVYRNSLNDRSNQALSRLNAAAFVFNQTLLQQRLAEKQVEPSVVSGVSFQAKEVATEQELGGFGLGFLLPILIIMWSVVGGQYAAVDVSAGEKERKTLEALLLTPVSRLQIVLGKFLAVATAALLSVVIALSSLYSVFIIGGKDLFSSATTTQVAGTAVQTSSSAFNFSLEPGAVLIMLAVSVLLVCLFSAMNLSVAIFAKSYKEAQSYIGPSYLVVILPVVFFNTMPGFQPSLGFFAIPIVNAVLLFKEVLIGVYHTGHILLTVAVMAVSALIVMYLASRIYQKEGVLFKE